MVFRILVEKKEPNNIEAKKVLNDLRNNLKMDFITNVRVINRYDVEDISEEIFEKARTAVFSEPITDTIVDSLPDEKQNIIFAAEFLPEQYDQRADSCSQCLQILTNDIRPPVRCAKVYIIETNGSILPDKLNDKAVKIKNYMINKVEAREATLDVYATLKQEYANPQTVETLSGFMNLSQEDLAQFLRDYSLSMDLDDILFCQDYFKNTEKREPTITEIRMLDAYWSDHCRHTTFLTQITDVSIDDTIVKDAFLNYIDIRKEVYGNKNKEVTLMDIATLAAKYLKKQGLLENLDESKEVNACSVKIKVNVNGKDEDYLLMFKNETHNHPTEIEPFGGASTCLGGGIRDPLSGRSYVYQAMRITGAADPRHAVEDTLTGKLPQRKITTTAADGYSSYGNQIGLASGGVYEIYHPNYVAKRMELGAIVGAAPIGNVKRIEPSAGDAIILLGGKTGRDGIGAASGSSRTHTSDSLEKGGAEVQKGDPIEERKIQRLFRNPEVASMIKRCNDFGAGGVSVAIGELADSLFIDLSAVPTKYPGLDGTEIAISESQERMAIVIADEHVNSFIKYANIENLNATKVATVTDDGRLRMVWNGNQILSLSREFLNSNGAPKKTQVEVARKNRDMIFNTLADKIKNNDIKQSYINLLSDLNICSQKGLVEQFGSSGGAGTVISPLGGALRLSPSQYMAAKIPTLKADTTTCSVMAHGFSPYVSEVSPYHGAMYAVVESISKLIAAGVNLKDMYLSFQEYFPGTKNDPKRFGMPFEALLGAFTAQIELKIAAIGGKDSMSGSYSYENKAGEIANIDVPPTLVSFAVGTSDAEKIISNEFKKPSSYVYFLQPYYNEDNTIDFKDLKNLYDYISDLAEKKLITSAYAVGFGGIGEAIFKMCVGNGIGFTFDENISQDKLFSSFYGSFIVETADKLPNGELLGRTSSAPNININNTVLELNELTNKWLLPLEDIFTTELSKVKEDIKIEVPPISYFIRPQQQSNTTASHGFAKPKVFIPVFPGTTSEYDSEKQFEEAGASVDTFVFRNLDAKAITESTDILADKIRNAQILMLPGGALGGDEPGGSGKFIINVFNNPKIADAINEFLKIKNGLILGISNGFQILVRLGLLPYGEMREVLPENNMTVGINRIGRHQSYVTYTRVASVNSPWFSGVNVGDVYALPVCHGEGRVCVSEEQLQELIKNGQIAAQYADINGTPTMHPYYNPNASDCAIEGIFSPDGRIFGKMGHSERIGKYVLKNISANTDQKIFISGVKYFK